MKMERVIYGIWLVMLGAVLVICSLERSTVLIDGTVRTLCFGLFGMTLLLHFLLLICRCLDKSSAFLQGLLQFAVFAAAAALYWGYCFRLDEMISTNSTMDALVAGGLFCAAAVAAQR